MTQSAVPPAANMPTRTERTIKVLFISHDAIRAGAEMFLLSIIRWMKDNGGFEMQIVLARGGELEAEFKALAPTWKIIGARMGRRDKIRPLVKRLALRSRGSDRRIFLEEAAARIGREFRPDVIYANTVTVAHVVS